MDQETREQIIENTKVEREVRQAGDALEHMAGYFDYHEKLPPLVERIVYRMHRTTQQQLMKLFVFIIRGWANAYRAGHYDRRNESTVRLAAKLEECIDQSNEYLPLI